MDGLDGSDGADGLDRSDVSIGWDGSDGADALDGWDGLVSPLPPLPCLPVSLPPPLVREANYPPGCRGWANRTGIGNRLTQTVTHYRYDLARACFPRAVLHQLDESVPDLADPPRAPPRFLHKPARSGPYVGGGLRRTLTPL